MQASGQLLVDTTAMLTKSGSLEFMPLFGLALDTIEDRKTFVEKINEAVAARVEVQVATRLKSDPPDSKDKPTPKATEVLKDTLPYGEGMKQFGNGTQ